MQITEMFIPYFILKLDLDVKCGDFVNIILHACIQIQCFEHY